MKPPLPLTQPLSGAGDLYRRHKAGEMTVEDYVQRVGGASSPTRIVCVEDIAAAQLLLLAAERLRTGEPGPPAVEDLARRAIDWERELREK